MSEGVRIDAAVAARGFKAEVTLPAGAITAVVGPNGAGKSTLLGLISGLLAPSDGRVAIDGREFARARSAIPAHRRPVALLEQRPLLFPHLTVLDNVAFGVRARGASTSAARARARQELEALGASAFADRRPGTLSGGEAQRVALARALATDPAVVLLDEPFGALDVPTAGAMRHVIASRLGPGSVDASRTVVLVTHDPLDVWALADRVVALEGGRVRAQGDVAALLSRPPTRFLAELSGTNLLRGVTTADERPTVAVGASIVTGIWDAAGSPVAGHQALATFTPASVALFVEEPHGSPRNTWPVRVRGIDPRGATVRVHLELPDGQPLAADLTAQGVAALALRPGADALAQVKATQVTLYPR